MLAEERFNLLDTRIGGCPVHDCNTMRLSTATLCLGFRLNAADGFSRVEASSSTGEGK